MFKLDGKTALVTGASGGIGAEIARTLHKAGAVVVLSGTRAAPLLPAVFLLAVGTAHASVLNRYWLTALAATVMALLQAHTVSPAGGFAVSERVADTLLGAALAWAFSFVLPAWERRLLPGTVAAVERTLAAYAGHALSHDGEDPVAQRLARRQAYDALAMLGAALQRSSAEPRAVRVPAAEVALLLDHGQRLMAHLSLVRMTLSRSGQAAMGDTALQALSTALESLSASLQPGARSPPPGPVADPEDLSQLPLQAPEVDILPWLLRRLSVLVNDAVAIRRAADTVRAQLEARGSKAQAAAGTSPTPKA